MAIVVRYYFLIKNCIAYILFVKRNITVEPVILAYMILFDVTQITQKQLILHSNYPNITITPRSVEYNTMSEMFTWHELLISVVKYGISAAFITYSDSFKLRKPFMYIGFSAILIMSLVGLLGSLCSVPGWLLSIFLQLPKLYGQTFVVNVCMAYIVDLVPLEDLNHRFGMVGFTWMLYKGCLNFYFVRSAKRTFDKATKTYLTACGVCLVAFLYLYFKVHEDRSKVKNAARKTELHLRNFRKQVNTYVKNGARVDKLYKVTIFIIMTFGASLFEGERYFMNLHYMMKIFEEPNNDNILEAVVPFHEMNSFIGCLITYLVGVNKIKATASNLLGYCYFWKVVQNVGFILAMQWTLCMYLALVVNSQTTMMTEICLRLILIQSFSHDNVGKVLQLFNLTDNFAQVTYFLWLKLFLLVAKLYAGAVFSFCIVFCFVCFFPVIWKNNKDEEEDIPILIEPYPKQLQVATLTRYNTSAEYNRIANVD